MQRRGSRFQARLVTAILLIAIPPGICLGVIDFLRGAHEYAAITAGFMLFCLVGLWLIKRHGKHQLVGILFNTIPVFTLTRAAFQESGLLSAYIPVLLMLPTTGFLMGERRGGILISFAVCCALTLLHIWGPNEPHGVLRYFVLVGTLAFWTGCVLTFYNFNRSALREVSRANNQLEVVNNQLEEQSNQLRKTLEANKEILGVTAHDLKNPLGGIIGLAEMVLLDCNEKPEHALISVEENLPMLRDEAERMLHIVKEVLDKHRLDEATTLTKSRVALDNLIATVLRWNEIQAKEKQIKLHVEAAVPAIVNADSFAIQRVVDNYISNAIKYSPSGTNVWVVMEPQTVDSTCDWATVKVSVRDEGPGLTPEDKALVFGKMQRLSAKPTGGEHSTGLGLFIVKSLVEAHGGAVGVDSCPGQGATFWFTLPVHTLS